MSKDHLDIQWKKWALCSVLFLRVLRGEVARLEKERAPEDADMEGESSHAHERILFGDEFSLYWHIQLMRNLFQRLFEVILAFGVAITVAFITAGLAWCVQSPCSSNRR